MTLDYGYVITINQNGQLDLDSSFTNQWQKQASGAGTWEDIENAAESTYAVSAGDRGHKIRLKQVFTNGQGVNSNELEVTNEEPPFDINTLPETGYAYTKSSPVAGDTRSKFGFKFTSTEDIPVWYKAKAEDSFAPYRTLYKGTNQTLQTSQCKGYYAFETRHMTRLSFMPCQINLVLEIDPISDFDTIEDFSYFLYEQPHFEQDLGWMRTPSAINMAFMFSGCSAITGSLDNLDTSKVTNMQSMFEMRRTSTGAPTVTPWVVDVSHFDTSKVTSMRFMFQHTENTRPVGISTWDTSNVTDMRHIFQVAKAVDESLHEWCVEKIFEAPQGWDYLSPYENNPSMHPKWGEACSP